METKIGTIDDEQSQLLYQRGLVLSELAGLFVFFLRHTPSGRQIRKEIETDWQHTCTQLRADKKIIGAEFSCAAWFKEVSKALLEPNKNSRQHKKPVAVKPPKTIKKQVLKFKNLP
jgi:hypothetical protein